MALLKEDGSLDVERINALPIEEFIKEIESLTDEQRKEWRSKPPTNNINEQRNYPRCQVVDYTLEDEIARGTAVLAEDIINNFKKKYGDKKQ